MSAPRVMVCFGTRPEAIKMAPVLAALAQSEALEPIAVSTGQHREMLDQALSAFDLRVDADLGVMRPAQGLADLTGRIVPAVGALIDELRPDALLVQGDTTTTFCAALAAFYADVPVGHVEAGLRTGDLRSPFPEEGNRRLVTPIARWHWCATERAAANLAREGIRPDTGALVEVTGNTVIDAVLATARWAPDARAAGLPPRTARRRVLVTLHRRESQGARQRALAAMLARVAQREDVDVLFPVHLSPAVRCQVLPELEGRPGVHLVDPLPYGPFVGALRDCDLVVTDSGGVQEEAPAFGVPALVMRDTTERPEGIEAGCSLLCGTDPEAVEAQVYRLLDDEVAYQRMADAPNPYGDGRAAARIVASLERDLASVTPANRTAASSV